MGRQINWETTYRARVANGWALVVLPYHHGSASSRDLRRFGTVTALEVLGRWMWVAKPSPTDKENLQMFSMNAPQMMFVGKLTPEEAERARKLPRVCQDRIDLEGPLSYWDETWDAQTTMQFSEK